MKKFRKINFDQRHIGPSSQDISRMLKFVGCQDIKSLIKQIIPNDIQMPKELNLDCALTENEVLDKCRKIGNKNTNHEWKNFIGMGFYNCYVPSPIIRNVLENPDWYTSYTPYQSEISQGRLECLFNFQTMISELTGLPVANASLLDEASAGAEAISMTFRLNKRRKYLLYAKSHPQTIAAVKTRSKFLDIEIVLFNDAREIQGLLNEDKTVGGIMLQAPDTDGNLLPNIGEICHSAHKNGSIVAVGTDLLSLCVTQPPSYFNVDIAFGPCQRMGNFLGFGGPHAAFFSCKQEYLRQMPGRIVGLTRDIDGNRAFRLMLQTREQHIKREKATSNICTSQALLANMTALYGIYHGPVNLKSIALNVHEATKYVKSVLNQMGHEISNQYFFDTLRILPKNLEISRIRKLALDNKINLRYFPDKSIGISIDETNVNDIPNLIEIFKNDHNKLITKPLLESEYLDDVTTMSKDFSETLYTKSLLYPRNVKFMCQEVFNKYHSETEFVRYVKTLENRDISLTNSMIPLGSCTLKLNATTELLPISWPCYANVHPYAPADQTAGYLEIIKDLEKDLCEITGMDAISFHSNSGAQGEYSGLCVIASYMKDRSRDDAQRKICLIPTSAHGTNFASAALAGMNIISLKTDKNGFLVYEEFLEALEKYGKELACLMITYPSTHGSFDPNIKDICKRIHESGGLVYMDGANMNAQIGLCRPGDFGADVCHLNLHKTFCIPHGGGGPGMGPIAVKSHLVPYLPDFNVVSDLTSDVSGELVQNKSYGSISSSKYASALILLIPWAYIKLMGSSGLKKATEIAILNANYLMKRLEPYFNVYKEEECSLENKFRCGHEFLLDLSNLKSRHGLEPVDIAKRLLDYGFHSPTVAFPITSCLMIEPTESEGFTELERFCEAMISIRREIDNISNGIYSKNDNPIKNAPHNQQQLLTEKWTHPYTRKEAAFPMANMERKVWPFVSRVDEIYGDQNPRSKH